MRELKSEELNIVSGGTTPDPERRLPTVTVTGTRIPSFTPSDASLIGLSSGAYVFGIGYDQSLVDIDGSIVDIDPDISVDINPSDSNSDDQDSNPYDDLWSTEGVDFEHVGMDENGNTIFVDDDTNRVWVDIGSTGNTNVLIVGNPSSEGGLILTRGVYVGSTN